MCIVHGVNTRPSCFIFFTLEAKQHFFFFRSFRGRRPGPVVPQSLGSGQGPSGAGRRRSHPSRRSQVKTSVRPSVDKKKKYQSIVITCLLGNVVVSSLGFRLPSESFFFFLLLALARPSAAGQLLANKLDVSLETRATFDSWGKLFLFLFRIPGTGDRERSGFVARVIACVNFDSSPRP